MTHPGRFLTHPSRSVRIISAGVQHRSGQNFIILNRPINIMTFSLKFNFLTLWHFRWNLGVKKCPARLQLVRCHITRSLSNTLLLRWKIHRLHAPIDNISIWSASKTNHSKRESYWNIYDINKEHEIIWTSQNAKITTQRQKVQKSMNAQCLFGT
jgi:hypothetical protein